MNKQDWHALNFQRYVDISKFNDTDYGDRTFNFIVYDYDSNTTPLNIPFTRNSDGVYDTDKFTGKEQIILTIAQYIVEDPFRSLHSIVVPNDDKLYKEKIYSYQSWNYISQIGIVVVRLTPNERPYIMYDSITGINVDRYNDGFGTSNGKYFNIHYEECIYKSIDQIFDPNSVYNFNKVYNNTNDIPLR